MRRLATVSASVGSICTRHRHVNKTCRTNAIISTRPRGVSNASAFFQYECGSLRRPLPAAARAGSMCSARDSASFMAVLLRCALDSGCHVERSGISGELLIVLNALLRSELFGNSEELPAMPKDASRIELVSHPYKLPRLRVPLRRNRAAFVSCSPARRVETR